MYKRTVCHPSVAGRAQDRESAGQRPTFYHCAMQPLLVQ